MTAINSRIYLGFHLYATVKHYPNICTFCDALTLHPPPIVKVLMELLCVLQDRTQIKISVFSSLSVNLLCAIHFRMSSMPSSICITTLFASISLRSKDGRAECHLNKCVQRHHVDQQFGEQDFSKMRSHWDQCINITTHAKSITLIPYFSSGVTHKSCTHLVLFENTLNSFCKEVHCISHSLEKRYA